MRNRLKLKALVAAVLVTLSGGADAQLFQAFPFLAPGLTTTPVQVKGSRGTLQWLSCGNTNTGIAFVQLFDVAPGTSITLGTTVPNASLAFAGGTANGAQIQQLGMAFMNGLKIAATTTAKGSTAPATALDCTAGFN